VKLCTAFISISDNVFSPIDNTEPCLVEIYILSFKGIDKTNVKHLWQHFLDDVEEMTYFTVS